MCSCANLYSLYRGTVCAVDKSYQRLTRWTCVNQHAACFSFRTITFIEEWDCGMAVTHHTLCGWNGCRGGGQKSTRETVIQWRLQAMKSFKLSLPCSIMGNVRSLANKLHEPTALAWSQRSLMCFTESWINQDIPDDNASVEGFHTVWANMDKW